MRRSSQNPRHAAQAAPFRTAPAAFQHHLSAGTEHRRGGDSAARSYEQPAGLQGKSRSDPTQHPAGSRRILHWIRMVFAFKVRASKYYRSQLVVTALCTGRALTIPGETRSRAGEKVLAAPESSGASTTATQAGH